MLNLAHLCPLAALFAVVSSESTPSFTAPAVYNNCSGDYPHPLPGPAASTSYFKPQILTNSHEKSTGWEEWLIFSQGSLADGSDVTQGYKWSLGDPASANLSQSSFTAWTFFPNGTLYHEVVQGAFKYEENTGGGFTCSIANNRLTWDPAHEFWNASINAEGMVAQMNIEIAEPGVPFAPTYNSTLGQVSEGFFSRMEVPRGHTSGYITFPEGLNATVLGVGSLKHMWSRKPIADTISAYLRGTAYFADVPTTGSTPLATVNWYQAWDRSGNEIDSMQLTLERDDSLDGQVFRIQITDVPDILTIVTTPTPASLPLGYNSTEISLPMCGPGSDFKNTSQDMALTMTNVSNLFDFTDSAGGVTLYQRVNATGVVWINGTSKALSGGIGVVELYYRG